MLRAVLIDDEFYALQGLKLELDKISEVEIVGMFQSCKEALKNISTLSSDVIFLDIDMPEMNGIECYQQLIEVNPSLDIIFVTAYDKYAVKAFELNAVDYLLKPVDQNRLIKALARIKGMAPQSIVNSDIYIKCFKHFEVLVDGQIINTGWRTKKAEELLAYLICEKGNFVSKHRLAEDLWPDLDGEKSLSNLYLAIYYLKKQEKLKGIVFPIESERGRMRILYHQLGCDLRTFDKGVMAAQAITEENIIHIKNAISVYTGQLLEDHYYHWLNWHQSRYQSDYENLVDRNNDYIRRK